jgi:hypothetical protein
VEKFKLAEITLRNTKNELYQRLPKVESQIREALALDRQALIQRVNQKDYKADDYFQEECLVYLARKFIREGNSEQIEDITTALIARISKHINGIVSYPLDESCVQDCFREVISEVFSQIFDVESSNVDYAEVRFWKWLDGRIFNVLRKFIRIQRKNNVTDSFDEHSENGKGYNFKEPPNYLRNKGITPEQEACILEGLGFLDERERQIYIMRYLWGMEIENQDSNITTISKHFQVTPRAVRKWFEKAENKLQKLQEGKI